MEFATTSRYTLGVEFEFQTPDAETLHLAPFAPTLHENAPPILRPRTAKDLIRSIFQIRTGVCFILDDMEYDPQQTCCFGEELAKYKGAVLQRRLFDKKKTFLSLIGTLQEDFRQ